MSDTGDALLQQALALPADERERLANALLDSLPADSELPIRYASQEEFDAELVRRLEEVEQHPGRLLDGEQVLTELRERFSRKTGT